MIQTYNKKALQGESLSVCNLHCRSLAGDTENSYDNLFYVFWTCASAFNSIQYRSYQTLQDIVDPAHL